jgi:hypothetical protein
VWLREDVQPGPQQAFMIGREYALLGRSPNCRYSTYYLDVAVWLIYADSSSLTRTTYFVY